MWKAVRVGNECGQPQLLDVSRFRGHSSRTQTANPGEVVEKQVLGWRRKRTWRLTPKLGRRRSRGRTTRKMTGLSPQLFQNPRFVLTLFAPQFNQWSHTINFDITYHTVHLPRVENCQRVDVKEQVWRTLRSNARSNSIPILDVGRLEKFYFVHTVIF